MLTLNSTTFPIRKKYLTFNLLQRTNSPTRQCQCSGMSNQPHPNSTIALSQKQYNRHNRHPLIWIPANLWNDLWPHASCVCVSVRLNTRKMIYTWEVCECVCLPETTKNIRCTNTHTFWLNIEWNFWTD